MKRLSALLGLFLCLGQAKAAEITLVPKLQETSFALNQTAVTGRYTATGNDTIRAFQFLLKPVSQSVTSQVEWAIVGSDAQDSFITLTGWNSITQEPDSEGFKPVKVGTPYQVTAGSLEHLVLSASTANEWQVKVSPVGGNFELVSVPEASSLMLGLVASLVVAAVCFAKNSASSFQLVKGDENKVLFKVKQGVQK